MPGKWEGWQDEILLAALERRHRSGVAPNWKSVARIVGREVSAVRRRQRDLRRVFERRIGLAPPLPVRACGEVDPYADVEWEPDPEPPRPPKTTRKCSSCGAKFEHPNQDGRTRLCAPCWRGEAPTRRTA